MQNHQDIKKLGDLISGIKVAMLTTLNEEGTFHSRPMWTQQVEFDGNLWFFTRLSGAKSIELKKDCHASVNYADPEKNSYLAVYGKGEVVQDPAKAKQLWSPAYLAWFPKGLEDPDLGLIKIQVERAEFWDSVSSKVVHLIGFVKALATGKPYQPGPNEHGKMDLTG
jgi:general stress protein 26